VFDLHWLAAQGVSGACTPENLRVRLATYPDETASAWLAKARARRSDLVSSAGAVAKDLKRWLPTAWPLTETTIQSMIQAAIDSLDEGMRIMGEIEETPQASEAGGGGS
jgi:hypothetical protein